MRVGISSSVTVGDVATTYTETNADVGEEVEFLSAIGQYVGNKAIARGVVIECLRDNEQAPITPTHGGKVANAWRNYYRILVTEIT